MAVKGRFYVSIISIMQMTKKSLVDNFPPLHYYGIESLLLIRVGFHEFYTSISGIMTLPQKNCEITTG